MSIGEPTVNFLEPVTDSSKISLAISFCAHLVIKGAATAACSATGSGQAARPNSSKMKTRSELPIPKPPNSSGIAIPISPVSESVSHKPSIPPDDSSPANWSASEEHSFSKMEAILEANCSCCSVGAKRIWLPTFSANQELVQQLCFAEFHSFLRILVQPKQKGNPLTIQFHHSYLRILLPDRLGLSKFVEQ